MVRFVVNDSLLVEKFIKTMIEQIKTMATDKCEYENRKSLLALKFFGIFGLS